MQPLESVKNTYTGRVCGESCCCLIYVLLPGKVFKVTGNNQRAVCLHLRPLKIKKTKSLSFVLNMYEEFKVWLCNTAQI